MQSFTIQTKGFCDVIDITSEVEGIVSAERAEEGICLISVAGSTCAITTIEYEEGAVEDLKKAIERLIPQNGVYQHDSKWGDGNGFAHVRAALLKPSLAFPISSDRLIRGTWQQIVLLDFDNRPRTRKVLVTIVPAALSS